MIINDSILNDSIINDNVFSPVSKIAENTEPLNFISLNLSWWSFFIAIASLFIGSFAARYSYQGYKFQRISADRLEKLIPGQISYYEVACSLINNILDIEAIFFGKKSYKSYPVELILSLSKLPDDLITLEKFEKKKLCYEEAFKIKVLWRNYNTILDHFLKNFKSYKIEKIYHYANYLITLSKSYIVILQNYESTLFENGYLESLTSSNERISYFILDRFLEHISEMDPSEYKSLDTNRKNLKQLGTDVYKDCPYLSNLIDMNNYLNSHHSLRFNMLHNNNSNDIDIITEMLESIKNGDYDELSSVLILPKEVTFSSIDFTHFKQSYFNFIEPIILGCKRHKYSHLFK